MAGFFLENWCDVLTVSYSGSRCCPTDDAKPPHAARKIAPRAGVVKSVLRLFDELAKCDPEGLLEGVREAVEGK